MRCNCGGKLEYEGPDPILGGDLYRCLECKDGWSVGDSLDGHGKHWFHYDADGNLMPGYGRGP